MPSANYTGPALALISVQQLTVDIIRVRFTNDPAAINPSGPHDALNLANYTLTGPGVGYFQSASPVPTDPQAIDLQLGTVLQAGLWTLTVANIETIGGDGLVPPFSLSFTVVSQNFQTPLSGGATNDDAFQVLKKHMGGGLNLGADGWTSLLRGLAAGDQFNFNTAELAFNQRFVASASGLYLNYLGSSEGVTRPPDLGMSDDLYRRLVILLTTGKLTEESFLQLLEIFYGADAVHGHLIAGQSEEYGLSEGDQLLIRLNERQNAVITFHNNDFAIPGAAKANEVAAAITREFQRQSLLAYSIPIQDSSTGLFKVAVYSSALGLISTVRCIGGNAQNVLQFPTLKVSADTAGTWTISEPDPNTVRFTTTGTTTVDLSRIVAGDYVNIFGVTFAPQNRGTFFITNVGITYPGDILTQFFDIVNLNTVIQSGVVINSPTDLMFFDPTRGSTFTTANRSVIVASNGPNEVDVTLPATTQVVQRNIREAAYLQTPQIFTPTRIERFGDGTVHLTVASHGLTNNTSAIIDGIAWNGTTATINPGTPSVSGSPGTSPASLGAGPLSLRNVDMVQAYWRPVIQLADNSILIAGGITAGGVDNEAQVMTLVAGGSAGDGSTEYTYNYLPSTPITWTGRATLFTSKAFLLTEGPHTGQVLFIGGSTTASTLTTYTNSTDLFDPTGPGFTSGPTMSVARGEFGACILADSRVLVSGGRTTAAAGSASATAEIYSPSTNTFTSTGTMISTRSYHTLSLLPNGNVLAAGGVQGTISTPVKLVCEVWNGSTWSETGGMCIPRYQHIAVSLPTGKVMVLGGIVAIPGISGNPAVQCELYDPTTGIWELTAPAPVSMVNCFPFVDSANNRLVVGTFDGHVCFFDYIASKWSTVYAQTTIGTQSGVLWHSSTGQVVFAGSIDTVSSLPTSAVQLINSNNSRVASTLLASDSMNGLQLLSVVDANTLGYQVGSGSYYLSTNPGNTIQLTTFEAQPAQYPGPFTYNTIDGVGITGTKTTTTTNYIQGGQYNVLTVADTSKFPNVPGYLSIGFGYDYQVAPIPYLGVLTSTELLLDFSFKFTNSTPSGATVNLLTGKGPFDPTSLQAEDAGSFYVTGSAAGRIAAVNTIEAAAAAGVHLNINITYPSDRGLGAEGFPVKDNYKLSDIVEVYAGNEVDSDVDAARTE